MIGAFISPAISSAATSALKGLIPPNILSIIANESPDAVTLGVTGSGNLPAGKFPFGVTGCVGFELLISPRTRNAALYDFYGGGLVFGSTSKSASLQGSGGLVYRSRHSEDYCGPFYTISIPYASLPQTVQNSINNKVMLVSGSTLMAFGANNVINTAFSLGIPTKGVLNKLSINIFWSPDTGRSCGFSFSYTLAESANSVSRVNATFTDYDQLAPRGDDGVENVSF
jgi:hypothetical protein